MPVSKIFSKSQSTAPKEEHWIPLSDLMTGLMMMFLLIAVLFMVNVDAEKAKVEELRHEAESQADRMKGIARLYDEMREQLYRDLASEFRSDLPRWKAVLDRDLTIRFEEPDVQFDVGKAVVKPQFARILDDFFPRYMQILPS